MDEKDFMIKIEESCNKGENYSGGRSDGIHNIIGRIRKKQRHLSFNLREAGKDGQK